MNISQITVRQWNIYAIAAYSTDGLMMTANKSKELFIGVIDETCLQMITAWWQAWLGVFSSKYFVYIFTINCKYTMGSLHCI